MLRQKKAVGLHVHMYTYAVGRSPPQLKPLNVDLPSPCFTCKSPLWYPFRGGNDPTYAGYRGIILDIHCLTLPEALAR